MLLHHLADALGQDVAKECLFLRSSLITKLFVASDVFTFLLQAGGGGMSAGSPDMAKIGQKVRRTALNVVFADDNLAFFPCRSRWSASSSS